MTGFASALAAFTAAFAMAASDGAAFDYDRTRPLETRIEQTRDTPGAAVTTLSYAGARGRVSATLVSPPGPGRHPAILYMHDSGHRRDEFLAEAILLARAKPGAVSLLLDAPPVRPVGWRRDFNSMIENNDRDIHIQAVIDLRRGIDLLAARSDVDPARIAFVGHGQGANWGAILCGIEPRLRASVLIAGLPSLTELMSADDPDWADMRFVLGEDRFARYIASLAVADPVRYTGASVVRHVLLQFGRFDPYVTGAMADRMARSFPEAPRVIRYDAGHDVNAPYAYRDRRAFLAAQLGPEPHV